MIIRLGTKQQNSLHKINWIPHH